MRVSDILAETKEAIGQCDTAIALTALTRGVQLLANKGLFDPLIGYFDFSLGGSYFVALPREVKTILRVNINKSPAFSRTRLFEFTLNTEGTAEGAENGLTWADRGYLPIQDERKLPGALNYKASNAADNGKTCTVAGLDEDGRAQTETLIADAADPVAGAIAFHKITRVYRDETAHECFLRCNGAGVIGQYYPDEVEPEYRVIKLSKNPAAVRIMFRRHVFELRTVDDFIPLHSHMAVIHAAKAVRFMGQEEYEKGVAALEMAATFLREEQAARDEHNLNAQTIETQTATNTNIGVRDGVTVGDIYDAACDIYGPIGRQKVFDKITLAIEALANRAHWDPLLGVVDVWSDDNTEATTQGGSKGHGVYILPRYVETPVSIDFINTPAAPRNRWYEFHLNGYGQMNRANANTWDDLGEVCLSKLLPLDPTADKQYRRAIPVAAVAVPDSADDDGTAVRVYGFEWASGREVEVWRDGVLGWACPCVAGAYDPGAGAPLFTRIERITKAASGGFIKFYTVATTPEVAALAGAITAVGSAVLFTLEVTGITQPFSAGATVRIGGADFEAEAVTDAGGGGYPTTSEWSVQLTAAATLNEGDSVYLITAEVNAAALEIGYWYPDETEPRYRAIKTASAKSKRLRVLYRKRWAKVTSLAEPIPLRSRLAVENMLRALKAQETDPAGAQAYAALAVRYLADERITAGPSETAALQFDADSMPGLTQSVT